MDEDQTTSVSKGVFVFKNGLKAAAKSRRSSSQTIENNNIFSDNLWYESYSNLWSSLEYKIEVLNDEMFSSVLRSLIAHIANCYENPVNEIPSAALLTGINMPDHKAQFNTLANQLKQQVTPHVAYLQSQDCQNLKCLVENMINQFINHAVDEDDLDTKFKKNQLSFALLQAWYEDLYTAKDDRKVLVVIVPDFETFSAKVLQDFVLIASAYINLLPFVLVFGIATSLTTLHSAFPYQVSSKINVQVFHSQPSTVYLNNVLENIFFTLDCPFQLSGKVFNLFTDIFLFYDLSVTGFIKNIKFAMLEHFCYGNAMALCVLDRKEGRVILNKFTHEDCENARQLLSFRKLVESRGFEERIKLLEDDDYFKRALDAEIQSLKKYIRRFHLFLRFLYFLVGDLPKAPLGKQVRELYSIASTRNITKTPEYKECFQLLNFQSKEELCGKITKICDLLGSKLNVSSKSRDTKPNILKDFLSTLQSYLDRMNNLGYSSEEFEEDVTICPEPVQAGKMDRKQLKETLLAKSKQLNKPLNKYENLRKNLLEFLSQAFQSYLVEPNSFHFHEIFFYNDISIQNQIVGIHRSSIHNALNDPQYYLQCACCEISNDSMIRHCMPDICIAYKLHLECGKMINLYDWLQAFLSIADPVEYDDDTKRVVDPELQARFTQAVAELEFLGFIKSSKRKADHVARLTWGG